MNGDLVSQISDLPVIDNHCHRTLTNHTSLGLRDWRLQFTEASGAGREAEDAASTIRYQRTIRRLASFYGVEAIDSAVLEARSTRGSTELRQALFEDANLVAVLYDEGYPDQNLVDRSDDLTSTTRASRLQRIETFLDSAAADCSTYDELVDRALEAWADIRAAGYVGLKSAIAYRTGLPLSDWTLDDGRAAFRAHKRTGSARVSNKVICDLMTDLAVRQAALQRCPVQIHSGYGDADVDLRLAHPLHIRQWLQREGYAGAPLVLLHGSFPYTDEASYMASVYPDVFLDVSFGIPHTSLSALRRVVSSALSQAPARKVLYSSDGYCIPEIHWQSALEAKDCVGRVLNSFVEDDELTAEDAYDLARRFFAANATELYGLPA